VRVLQVIPSLARSHGGPSRAVVGLSRALAQSGVEVELVATRHDLGRDEEAALSAELDPVRLSLVPAIGPARLELGLGVEWALWRRLPRFDVVHVHSVFTHLAAVAPMLCRRARVPHVVRPAGTLDAACLSHGLGSAKALAFRGFVARNLEAAEVVQATSAHEAHELGQLVPRARIAEAALGIDAEPVAPDGGARGRRVGVVGRLHPIKGLERVLAAVARVPTVELWVAGDGDVAYRAQLQALAVRLGLSARVRWLGHLDRPALRQLHADCDLFVFASAHENFGVAAAEVLAAGRALVVTAGVALADAIAEAEAGLVVADDAEAIAAGIEALVDDGARRARMAARARTLAERWRWPAVVRATFALYEQAQRTVRDAGQHGRAPEHGRVRP
jgi:glycosyltransferase involved in cell wall biosynthesis